MIQFTPHMRILVCTTPMDMRNGIDGISSYCTHALGENPMSGAVFLFISRSRKQIKVLVYDGQGFWLCAKRLSFGRFPHWPKADSEAKWLTLLQSYEAQVLVHGGDPSQVNTVKPWKKISLFQSFYTGVG